MKDPFLPILKNKIPLKSGFLWRLWLFFHLGIPLLLLLSLFLIGPVQINTLLNEMLPGSGKSRTVAKADAILGEVTSREGIILAAASDFGTAKKGAVQLYNEFISSADFESLSLYFDQKVMAEFIEYLYQYRFVIAGKETLDLLETGRAEEIAMDALASAYGLFNFSSLDNIDRDPFLLTERRTSEFLSSSLLSGGNLSLTDDVLAAQREGIWYVMLRINLAPRATSLREGQNAVREIYAVTNSLKQNEPGLEFYFSGIPFHSYESSSGAQREISFISTITLIIILILFFYVFRSPLPVLLSILAAGFSLGMASAAALLVFREIHIITFVFGTTLIGTCVDYSVHFFVHWKGNSAVRDGDGVRACIKKSIVMSFISTEICFFVFLLAPFPILKQFAVFSFTGLTSSFLTALCMYPRLKLPKENRSFKFFTGKLFKNLGKFSLPPALRIGLVIGFVVLSLAMMFLNSSHVKIENDISSLYTMSASMLESEKRTALVMDYGSPGWYFIVSGSSPEETLENEESLCRRLDQEINRGNLGSYLAASVFVPSVKKQQETYEAMKALLHLVPAQFEYLGFPPEYTELFHDEFAKGEIYCGIEDAPSYAGISNLWIGESSGNYFSCVIPLKPANEEIFRSLENDFDYVHFMNKARDISRDLDTLTRTMLLFFLAAYLVISVLIFFMYPRRQSLRICAVPFLLILITAAVLAMNGIPLGFFSAAGLILVFGLGLDYIFYMIGKKGGEGRNLTLLGVVLSFLTTILSFGALAFSNFAPVHIFGLTVSAGLSGAFISALLLRDKETSENH